MVTIRNGLSRLRWINVAEGIAAKSIGNVPLAIASELVDDMLPVSEQSI